MSSVFDLEIDGSSEKALPRDVAYDPLSDEPIHIDFMRVEKDANLILEIPVKFINQDKSPGLKKRSSTKYCEKKNRTKM
jgi:large subunit ribosomal protein L25